MLNFIRSFIQDPSTLAEQELEPLFVNLKNKILITNVYSEGEKHKKIYNDLGVILARLLSRHERYILDIESQRAATMKFQGYFILDLCRKPIHQQKSKTRVA